MVLTILRCLLNLTAEDFVKCFYVGFFSFVVLFFSFYVFGLGLFFLMK